MHKRSCFKTADLTETDSRLCNPNRGFYQMFSMCMGEAVDYTIFEQCLVKEESLVLLMVELSHYREQPIEDAALAKLGETIAFFASHGKHLIVRAAYDTKGQANCVEPEDFDLVKTHLKQIFSVLADYEQYIFVYQGLLVGNWGEMHGTKHLTRHHLAELAQIADEYLPEKVYLAVRKPAQYRTLRTHFSEQAIAGECRIGLFDDAILSSRTDLGTYSDGEATRYDCAWSREKELAFIQKLCVNVPLGGETVLGDNYVKSMQPQAIIDCLAMMHVTYLNRLYDTQMLDYFKSLPMKKGVFKNKKLYDYIEAHLGYRYLVKNAGLVKKGETKAESMKLKIEIANVGFACAYNEIEVFLAACFQSEKKMIRLGNLQEIGSGESKCYHVTPGDFDMDCSGQKIKLFVCAKDCSGGEIFFANEMTKDGVFLGTLSNY